MFTKSLLFTRHFFFFTPLVVLLTEIQQMRKLCQIANKWSHILKSSGLAPGPTCNSMYCLLSKRTSSQGKAKKS